jgi:hypothetical protein
MSALSTCMRVPRGQRTYATTASASFARFRAAYMAPTLTAAGWEPCLAPLAPVQQHGPGPGTSCESQGRTNTHVTHAQRPRMPVSAHSEPGRTHDACTHSAHRPAGDGSLVAGVGLTRRATRCGRLRRSIGSMRASLCTHAPRPAHALGSLRSTGCKGRLRNTIPTV